MKISKAQKIHLVGVGGIGLSALAKMFSLEGKEVSGSDLFSSEITQELEEKYKIKIFLGHKEENLDPKTDLLIYSQAIGENNPERKKAFSLKIPQLSYPEILGELSKEKKTIAISGTHGKSTTTSLIGLILEEAKFDPLVIVGSRVKKFSHGNLRIPKKKTKFFVVEACEYKRNFLKIEPWAIVLTNIEKDHLDYYKNLLEIKETFKEFILKLPSDGLLVLNADDLGIKELKEELILKKRIKVITYGIKEGQVQARNIRKEKEKQKFDLFLEKEKIGEINLKIPGNFNIYNALASIALSFELGIDYLIFKKVIEEFKGIWRRFEIIGEREGAIIISDYAHHPTAVFQTIKAAKEFYSQKKIIAVFQPHQHNRTKNLFDDFVKSFSLADIVILSEIYQVTGREEKEDQDISSKNLVEAIKDQGKKEKVFYGKDLKETKELILRYLGPNSVILIMGAGDIYKIAQDFIDKK